MAKARYKFGQYVLSPSERLLWREVENTDSASGDDGADRLSLRPVAVEPKLMTILIRLVEQAPHVVLKEALIREIWGMKPPEENTLTRDISELRKLLAIEGEDTVYIAPVSRKGYCFVCPVTVLGDGDDRRDDRNDKARLVELPELPNRLIGRSKEIAEIERLAESARVITLVGDAGIGKTSLAIKTASQLRARYAAVRFVPLADIMDAGLIIDEIAAVLGVDRSNPELREAVVRALSRQPSLLVLDNFEQIVDKGALLVKELVQNVRGLTCLVTSRRRLRIAEESWFQISPLAVPGDDLGLDKVCEVESVQLFLERARAANPGFALSEETAGQIATICRLFEGIPLAIELVAMRMDEFSPSEILESLEREGLLELLVSEQRDAIPRHRSLHIAIEWSYRLLTPDLQQLFARSSIFRGGFTIEAAERVCEVPEARNSLNRLVDHSLLKRGFISNTRYRMIEVYREFGDEKLSQEEREAITQKHAEHFFGLAALASQKLLGGEQNAWLDRLELERDNLQAALDYYRCGESTALRELEFSVCLGRFWDTRGYWSDGRQTLRQALARQQPGDSNLKAKGLIWIGLLSYRLDDYEYANQVLSESSTISRKIDDGESLAFSLNCQGLVAEAQGRYSDAKSLFTESLKLSEDLRLSWLIGWAFHGLGLVAEAEADYEAANDFHQKSLLKREEIADLRGIATSLNNLGVIAREQGNYSEARQFHEKSLALRQGGSNKGGIALCFVNLGLVEEAGGKYQEACAFFQKSLVLRREILDRRGMARAMEAIARMAEAMGKGEDSARIFGSAEVIRRAIAAPVSPSERKLYDRILSSVKERFPSAWEEGGRWSLDEAIAYAISVSPA